VTPLRVFVFGIMKYFEAKISLKRISRMLLLPDIKDAKEKFYLDDHSIEKGQILMNNVSFSYFDKEYEQQIEQRIKDIIGEIPEGKKGKGGKDASKNPDSKNGKKFCANIR
jgi:hypothetical protein